MPSAEQVKQQARATEMAHEQRSGVLASHLLQALGRPKSLYRVEVRLLWDNHYRANVFVGADAASVKIAHSFFLEADEDGNILTSTPGILREY